MAAYEVHALPAAVLAKAQSPFRPRAFSPQTAVAALLLPSLVFLAMFFALPALGLPGLQLSHPGGRREQSGLPLTLEHYTGAFSRWGSIPASC